MTGLTIEACRKLSRSCLRVEDGITRPSHVGAWIVEHEIRVRNVAGHRESRALGIDDRVERFLTRRVPPAGARADLTPPALPC